MEMWQLSYFVEIAQQRSFTKAAQKLNISQPALSKCIHNLEEELGVGLFIRKAGAISLTEAGELVLENAKELLIHFQEVQNTLQDLKEKRGKNIFVGCSPLLSSIFGIDLLNSFFADGNDTNLSYYEGTSEQMISCVFHMELDLAICILFDREYKYLDKVNAETVCEGHFLTVRDDGNSGLQEGSDEKRLVVPCDLLPLFPMNDAAQETKPVLFTNHPEDMKKLLKQSDAVALIPDVVLPFWESDVSATPYEPKIQYRIVLVTNPTVKAPKLVQRFKRRAREKIRAAKGLSGKY